MLRPEVCVGTRGAFILLINSTLLYEELEMGVRYSGGKKTLIYMSGDL